MTFKGYLLKIVSIVSLFAVFDPLAFADYGDDITFVLPCPPCSYVCQRLHDGVYVGASLGYDDQNIRQHAQVEEINGNFLNSRVTVSARGIAGNLLVGYGRFFAWFYMGGEVSIGYSGAFTSYRIDAYHSRIGLRENYAASLLPGIRLNNSTSFYLRGGAVRSLYATRETGVIVPAKRAEWGNGYLFGVGVQTAIAHKVSIRGEIIHNKFGSIDSPIATKSNASNNQFLLSIIYHTC